MRTRLIALAATLQVLVLVFMAAEREWIVQAGRVILLRTAPIDPNDPMRGYYARFNYDITNVPKSLWRDGLPAMAARAATSGSYNQPLRDLRVYATLKLDDAGIATLASVSDQQPASGLYLQGRVNAANNQQTLDVRYGIEALFMQQGESLKLEQARARERPGAAIDAEIAVSPYGVAVLKGYQWEPLGLIATFEQTPFPPPEPVPPPAAAAASHAGARPSPTAPRPQRRGQFISAVKIELKNYGTEDIAIVDLPIGGSFRLVSNDRGQEIRYRWTGQERAAVSPPPDQVFVLKPGQSRTTRIDLTQPPWFVIDLKAKPDQAQPIPLRDITDPWSASFRLEYTPPAKSDITGLPHADLIRFYRVRSRAFNPTQGMD